MMPYSETSPLSRSKSEHKEIIRISRSCPRNNKVQNQFDSRQEKALPQISQSREKIGGSQHKQTFSQKSQENIDLFNQSKGTSLEDQRQINPQSTFTAFGRKISDIGQKLITTFTASKDTPSKLTSEQVGINLPKISGKSEIKKMGSALQTKKGRWSDNPQTRKQKEFPGKSKKSSELIIGCMQEGQCRSQLTLVDHEVQEEQDNKLSLTNVKDPGNMTKIDFPKIQIVDSYLQEMNPIFDEFNGSNSVFKKQQNRNNEEAKTPINQNLRRANVSRLSDKNDEVALFGQRYKSIDSEQKPSFMNKKRDKSPIQLSKQPTLTPIKPGKQGTQNRIGDSQIYCQAWQSEAFIKRAIGRLGWVLTVPKENFKQMVHIRFTIEDQLENEKKDVLKGIQFYNHFPGNRELTTKAGLCRNLWFNSINEQEFPMQSVFPRCYDLSDSKQDEQFISDFNQTAILSLLKLVSADLLQKSDHLQHLVEQYAARKQFNHPHNKYVKNFKQTCRDFDRKSKAFGYLLGDENVRLAYRYASDLIRSLKLQELNSKNKKGQTNKSKGTKLLSDRQINEILEFYNESLENGFNRDCQFETYEQVKIVTLHNKLEQLMTQYKQIDGQRNIWIVKPSFNARGIGIYCARQLNQIVSESKKAQQKVVQKYIERPFLVHNSKKFDVRQWVLVNSWEPLDVCVFSDAYLRLCRSDFDLNDIKDSMKHLSNYSLQKKQSEETEGLQVIDPNELVMSTAQFEQIVKQEKGKESFSWKETLLPQIKSLVWRTLKAMQDRMEQSKNCFEVYGFDIMLTEDQSSANFNPWLIEVNLSPACAERTPWLTQMLNDSTIDMLAHIQDRILLSKPAKMWAGNLLVQRESVSNCWKVRRNNLNLNAEEFYSKFQVKNRWERLEQSIKEIQSFYQATGGQGQDNNLMTLQSGIQLEVIGTKINDLKRERKIDLNWDKEQSAEIINRVYRGYCARQRVLRMRQNLAAIRIQRIARVVLAKNRVHFIKKTNASLYLQKHLRRLLCLNVKLQLREEHIFQLKIKLVTKLQTLYRMWKAKELLHRLREFEAAKRLQRFMKGRLVNKQKKEIIIRHCAAILIQRYLKRRSKLQNRSILVLQRLAKAWKVQQKYRRLMRSKQFVLKIQSILVAKCRSTLASDNSIDYSSVINLRMGRQSNDILGRLLALLFTSDFISRLKLIRSVSRIQCFWRMIKAQRKRKWLQIRQKWHNLRLNLKRGTVALLIQAARMRRESKDIQAIRVQRFMKGLLTQKLKKGLRKQFQQSQASKLLQRRLRGILGRKEARFRRIEIGASIMIQSLFRGFRIRKALSQGSHVTIFSSDTRTTNTGSQNLKNRDSFGRKFSNPKFAMKSSKQMQATRQDQKRFGRQQHTVMSSSKGMQARSSNRVVDVKTKQKSNILKIIEKPQIVKRPGELMTQALQKQKLTHLVSDGIKSQGNLALQHQHASIQRQIRISSAKRSGMQRVQAPISPSENNDDYHDKGLSRNTSFRNVLHQGDLMEDFGRNTSNVVTRSRQLLSSSFKGTHPTENSAEKGKLEMQGNPRLLPQIGSQTPNSRANKLKQLDVGQGGSLARKFPDSMVNGKNAKIIAEAVDAAEKAHQQSLAAQKLLQRTNTTDSRKMGNFPIRTVTMGQEVSKSGKGSGKTILMRKEPSREQLSKLPEKEPMIQAQRMMTQTEQLFLATKESSMKIQSLANQLYVKDSATSSRSQARPSFKQSKFVVNKESTRTANENRVISPVSTQNTTHTHHNQNIQTRQNQSKHTSSFASQLAGLLDNQNSQQEVLNEAFGDSNRISTLKQKVQKQSRKVLERRMNIDAIQDSNQLILASKRPSSLVTSTEKKQQYIGDTENLVRHASLFQQQTQCYLNNIQHSSKQRTQTIKRQIQETQASFLKAKNVFLKPDVPMFTPAQNSKIENGKIAAPKKAQQLQSKQVGGTGGLGTISKNKSIYSTNAECSVVIV